MEYEELNNNFNLVKKIIKQNESIINSEQLNNIEKIIDKDLPNTIKKTAPVNFPDIYFDFKYEYDKFKEFILYNQLIGKNIVALGGGFSSGKSSFLNSILKQKLLPASIDPSTSVPTYIVNDESEYVYGINIFNNEVKLDKCDLKSICHGFGEMTDENDDVTEDEVKLGHILKSIFLATPTQIYKHIAFLDTPGYSKPDTNTYSIKTDEKIAKAQLNSSNFILWFIQGEDGTIKQDDIDFLSKLKKEIPKLIIINKADKLTNSSINDVKKQVKEILDLKGIMYIDVLSYSRKKTDEYDSEKIKYYLTRWNNEIYECNFARNFKILFVKCKNYYDDLISTESKRLNRLNTSLTFSENDVVTECLSSLINEIKRHLNELKEDKKNLKKLQDEFFTEIKIVSDKFGIEMPEPSEIDLIQDKIQNQIEEIKKYKEKNNIKSNPNISIKIIELMSNVNAVINEEAGGWNHKNKIYKSIKEIMMD